MTHAAQRAVERCSKAGLDPLPLLAKANNLARRYPETHLAVRLAELPAQVGEAWGKQSNGDQVWAVCRNGRPVTVMLRRSTQPPTAAAPHVQRVLALR